MAQPSRAVMCCAVDILRVGEAQHAVRVAGGVEIEQLAQADLLVPVRVELDRRASAAADAADAHRSHRRMALEHAHAHHGHVVRPVIDRRVDLHKSQGKIRYQVYTTNLSFNIGFCSFSRAAKNTGSRTQARTAVSHGLARTTLKQELLIEARK